MIVVIETENLASLIETDIHVETISLMIVAMIVAAIDVKNAPVVDLVVGVVENHPPQLKLTILFTMFCGQIL
jgi:hypothetical protein